MEINYLVKISHELESILRDNNQIKDLNYFRYLKKNDKDG